MLKINNKEIINNILYSLGILAILAFGVIIMPIETKAWVGIMPYIRDGYVNTSDGNVNTSYYENTGYNNNSYNANQGVYQAPIYIQSPASIPTPIIYSDSTNPSQTKSVAAPKTVAKAKTISTTKADNSSLAAGAILGSNSFMPSSLIQWIFFAILVLLVVMLVRKVVRAEENYYSAPMKHD